MPLFPSSAAPYRVCLLWCRCVQTHPSNEGLQASAHRAIDFLMKAKKPKGMDIRDAGMASRLMKATSGGL